MTNATEKMQPQKRGRPATGKGTPIQVRIQPDLLDWIDAERAHIDPEPTRPEFIRQLIESYRDLSPESEHAKVSPKKAGPIREPTARFLLWTAKLIRNRDPKPGSFRDLQAALYERLAVQIIDSMAEIERTRTKND